MRKLRRLMRRKKVEEVTGLSRSTIYEMMAAGKFPRPVSLGESAAKGWIEDEVAEWVDLAIARRDSGMVVEVAA